MKYYVDRMVNGKMESLLIDDWNYKCWVGCYCKVEL
jgi:hypothetical protein